MSKHVVILALLFIATVPLARADCPLEGRGYWGGDVNGLILHDGVLFASIGRHLDVIESSQPGGPRRIGRLALAAPSQLAGIDGDYLYAYSESTLIVVNISDPARPLTVGTLELDEPGFRSALLSAAGQCIYATLDEPRSALGAIDISTPQAPRLTALIDLPDAAQELALVHNSHAYGLLFGGGLYVIDISAPRQPLLLDEIMPDRVVRAMDGGGQTPVAAIDGLGLVTLDLSSPLDPQIIGQSDALGRIEGLRAVGTRVLARQDRYTTDLGLFSIADPGSPQLLAMQENMPGIGCMELGPDYAVVADRYENVAFFGNPLPGVLYPANRYFDAGWMFEQITSDGANFVGMAGDTLKIVGMIAGEPALIGVYEIPPFTIGGLTSSDTATAVCAAGGYLYLTTLQRGLQVIDLADPSSPRFVRRIDGESRVHAVRGNRAFATGGGEFVIFDLAEPSEPRRLGSVPLSAGAHAFVAADDSLACVLSQGDLTVLDVSDPSLPVVTATISVDEYVAGVALYERTAYVATHRDSLEAYDLSDPARPVKRSLRGAFRDKLCGSVRVQDHQLYVTSDGDIQVADLTNPLEPQLLAYYVPDVHLGGALEFAGAEVAATGGLSLVVARRFFPGDIDGDADVDLGDLGLLLPLFGQFVGGGPGNGDFNCDGWVDAADLSTLLASFGNR